MKDEPVIGQRHYKGGQNPEIERLRKIEQAIHEETIDVQVLLGAPVPIDFPIPAIRAWNLENDTLISLAMPYAWDSPVQREKTTLSKRGTTGFWAVKPSGIEVVKQYDPHVVGLIELSGRVIEHEYGWRGEVCTIVELFVLPWGPRPSILSLEQRYQCDVSVGSYDRALYALKGLK